MPCRRSNALSAATRAAPSTGRAAGPSTTSPPPFPTPNTGSSRPRGWASSPSTTSSPTGPLKIAERRSTMRDVLLLGASGLIAPNIIPFLEPHYNLRLADVKPYPDGRPILTVDVTDYR